MEKEQGYGTKSGRGPQIEAIVDWCYILKQPGYFYLEHFKDMTQENFFKLEDDRLIELRNVFLRHAHELETHEIARMHHMLFEGEDLFDFANPVKLGLYSIISFSDDIPRPTLSMKYKQRLISEMLSITPRFSYVSTKGNMELFLSMFYEHAKDEMKRRLDRGQDVPKTLVASTLLDTDENVRRVMHDR